MGFDLYGQHPDSPEGEYFRNNVWWWRPLANFVLHYCDDILSPLETKYWQSNDGQPVSQESAIKIAERLRMLVDNGTVAEFERKYTSELEAQPDIECKFCHGTGTRDDDFVKGKCNACDGTGKVRPNCTHYPFSTENVVGFATFCEHSGGFEIW